MARAKAYPGFEYLGGLSRNYKNIATGEVLSRRQYDKLYGSLARSGFNSYETKAQASPEAVRKSRPARGRPTAKASKARNLNPLVGRTTRTISMDVDATKGEDFFDEMEDYRNQYDDIVGDILANKKIFGLMIILETDKATFATGGAFEKNNVLDFDVFTENAFEKLYDGSHLKKVNFVVRFFDVFLKEKQKTKRRQLKVNKRK